MSRDINKMVRKNIRNLVPYSSARDEYKGSNAILLDANENPFNAPQNRYPDPLQSRLKERLSSIKGIRPEQIYTGNGSDEAIDLLFRIFCEPGEDNAVSISPTYGMYSVCADINNVKIKKAALNADFTLNTETVMGACDSRTKLLFICSPNNPTSNSFLPSQILGIAESLDAVVVVDEAYIDFSDRESLIGALDKYPNLVILQTLSKAWGLAGIRLGMAFASPEIIGYMNRVKYPYNVNRLTAEFAFSALNDEESKNDWVSLILSERKEMEKKLKMFRFVHKVNPSDANFLLVKVNKPKELYNYLISSNIVVRDRSAAELCEGAVRITIGTPDENKVLIAALMDYQRKFVESCEQ